MFYGPCWLHWSTDQKEGGFFPHKLAMMEMREGSRMAACKLNPAAEEFNQQCLKFWGAQF